MSEMATTSSPAVRARRTWNMDQWGSGYFDVDDHGQAQPVTETDDSQPESPSWCSLPKDRPVGEMLSPPQQPLPPTGSMSGATAAIPRTRTVAAG